VKTSMRDKQIGSLKQGLSRASGTKSFTRNAVPGLKSWAKFTASLRDEDREASSHSLFRRGFWEGSWAARRVRSNVLAKRKLIS
jgi:hypothetical protein